MSSFRILSSSGLSDSGVPVKPKLSCRLPGLTGKSLSTVIDPHCRVACMGAKPRMTLPTLKVLKVLLSDPFAEHYGLQIAKEAGLPSGTIYPILVRLEGYGWVVSDWEQIDPVVAGRRPRRYYRLSSDGAEKARHQLREAQRLFSPQVSRGAGLPAPGAAKPGDATA
jgi:PadR family transcriptional regulator PadR